MESKTTQPSEDEVSNEDGTSLEQPEANRSPLFAPSNQGDLLPERLTPSRLQLSDFHNLVRSSSAAIACIEFPLPVPCVPGSSILFAQELYRSQSTCLEASDSFARMRGHVSANDILDKPLAMLLPRESGYLSLLAEWHRRSLTTQGFEWEVVDAEGRAGLFHVALYGNLIEGTINRLWIVLRDISALARAITAVTKIDQHYRGMLDREELLYLRAYADGTLSCASNVTQRDFHANITPTSNIDEILGEACHPEDRGLIERLSYHRRSLSREPLAVTLRLVSETSGLGLYNLIQHPHLVGDVVDAYDVVGIKYTQKPSTIPNDLLSPGFAHDANNQLLIASSAIERARLGLPPGHPSNELLESALSSISHCAKINAQSIEASSGVKTHLESVNVEEILSDVVKQCATTLPAGIAINRSSQSEPLWAWSDRTHLNQALINLVLNARDALGTSGVITLSATRKGYNTSDPLTTLRRTICISVSDNGPGIPPAVSNTIFQPFVSTRSSSRNRGLGLTMVKTLIEQGGGEVTMTTAQGLGTTFTLSLPEARSPQSGDSPRIVPISSATRERERLRILIADDEPEVRKTLLCSLLTHGAETTAVPDSASLIKELSRTPRQYDIVIVDDGMPGSSAIELSERIRAINPNVPVIVTSGDTSLSKKLIQGPRQRFLAKPFTMADLQVTIDSMCETTG